LINRQLQNFTWPIPYADLVLDLNKYLRIQYKEDFLIFEKGEKANAIFIERILKQLDLFE